MVAITPLVAVSRLAVSFGPVRALDGVDLVINPGEIVALAGENGAGKTTLVRCLAGDLAPAGGEVLLEGRPIPTDPLAAARRGVGVVWQDLSLCDNLDIAANLLLGRERRWRLMSDFRMHAQASQILRRINIPLTDTTRSVRALSGGERQLVAIARAMVPEPSLLLLDEPTASLSIRHAAQVERLLDGLRGRATVVIASHDIDLMFRLADRIVVLRHGRVFAEVNPVSAHPDEVAALLAGQELDSSARRQLTRLHGLTGSLVTADASASLKLILSALGAALGRDRLAIHLAADAGVECAASLGLPAQLRRAWARLPVGAAGGPVGLAAATGKTVVASDVADSPAWLPFAELADSAGVASSWSVPVLGRDGVAGVITVFGEQIGHLDRDQIELVTVYAGYAASAIERDRLLAEVTERNRVLETIREMLETLAGPVPVADGLAAALRSLCHGLQVDEVALATWTATDEPRCRGSAIRGPVRVESRASTNLTSLLAPEFLADRRHDGTARFVPGAIGQRVLAVTFEAPGGPSALIASWRGAPPTSGTRVLIADAANSLRLALEREQAGEALQEAAALRRSQELQRDFLSRLSHELRTPLTAIRGYATSLLQPDVTWDQKSEQRFLTRIASESSRLGRLVEDLLDFSAIELGIMRLHPDWCDIGLVLEASVACLPPDKAAHIDVVCPPKLPAVWGDHDRLEQVFVNLLANAVEHNPPRTPVSVRAAAGGSAVEITVADRGVGLPPEVAAEPFEARRSRSRSAGSGLGLSIARGIVTAHGGRMDVMAAPVGTSFVVRLPVEGGTGPPSDDEDKNLAGMAPTGPDTGKGAGGRGRSSR